MKNIHYFYTGLLAIGLSLAGCRAGEDIAINSGGKAGSMAKFNLTGNYLYLAESDSIQVVDVSEPNDPKATNKVPLNTRAETIFSYNHMLFIGSPIGMEILSLGDPANPTHLGFANHIIGCDPVVAQGDYAYVTVRGESDCRLGDLSRYIVNDISNPQNPHIIFEEFLENPYGLGVKDSLLYICTGENGLQVFNISNPEIPSFMYSLDSLHAWDVIPDENRLIVIGEDGLYQYDFSDPANPAFLSQIPQ